MHEKIYQRNARKNIQKCKVVGRLIAYQPGDNESAKISIHVMINTKINIAWSKLLIVRGCSAGWLDLNFKLYSGRGVWQEKFKKVGL